METSSNSDMVTEEVITPEPYRLTLEEVEAGRLAAYQREADPLFFKWQRGEAEKQEWLDKIAEIKLRFVYIPPEEVPEPVTPEE